MSGEKGLGTKNAGPGIARDGVEVLIVGAGTMGASLAQAYAQSGFGVGLLDVSDEILDRAKRVIDRELAAARKNGLFSDSQVAEIRGRIRTSTNYAEACRGKALKLVIETATENIEVKKRIFRQLDELCPPGVILATNSSSLDINILARQTARPDKVVWMHFFYLPHKNRAGEYAGSESASRESLEAAAKYMKMAGKLATPILNSRKGGAADVIFVSLLLEASRMVAEGMDIPSIEAAGREAFGLPMGFLGLMDATGIPLGIYTMYSFSDASNPDDSLFRAYGNFFSPPECCQALLKKHQEAADKSSVRWVSPEDAKRTAGDRELVARLRDRFRAVGFMTAAECVEAGVIALDDVDRLCRNAFLWREGPFALMNRIGLGEVMRIVNERAELSLAQGIHFPVPRRLVSQAKKMEPWPLDLSPVVVRLEGDRKIARIMISNPQTANALDNRVFEDLKSAFRKANQQDGPQVIIFDSAPIKTFIAGANVPDFIQNINRNNFQGIKDDTARWQDVIFHEITGGGRPKIAIVDGATFGGGVEVALAFALDPGSVVVITDRTAYSLPETRLGIFPGLRGTLTLPQAIYKGTGDAELAVAVSRYLILSGGTATASPRLIKSLGLADFLVPARRRDEVAEKLARAIIDHGGKPLSATERASLEIEELPAELTQEEKEELRVVKDLFLRKDLVPTLYAYGRGQAEIFFSGENKALAERIARRVVNNSPHAVQVADGLISQGYAGFLKGKSLDELAQRELDYYLVPTFEHPDALEGLTALVERRFPEFNRMLPF
ncbi:MAG: 3-hydroxyacyl-CoA dehydrogenase NAD-binding domain-containing protein [Candidatus Aminicenantes bacterium]|nr:3-hydroxyacyl-CoA dehydrogenase NAD-binding domain-containing protein [Candidatus Aminicenantes bacterium]